MSTFTIDETQPTVTVEQDGRQDDPTNASPVEFDAVFSEDVNRRPGDVTVSGSATTAPPR